MPTRPDTSKFTPLFRQWLRIKQQLPGVLVLFRLGDFYEMFGDDAEIGSRELGLTLTSRDCSPGERIPMCGAPHHALDRYLRQLVDKGYRVAVVDQTEDPKKAKGLVRREVSRVVSAGTILEDELLPGAESNFLMSVACADAQALGRPRGRQSTAADAQALGRPGATSKVQAGERLGLALVDVSTADFLVTEVPVGAPTRPKAAADPPDGQDSPEASAEAAQDDRLLDSAGPAGRYEALVDEVARIAPAEVLLTADLAADEELREALAARVSTPVVVADEDDGAFASPARELREFFAVASLEGYGCADLPAAQAAAAQAVRFLRAQRPTGLPRFPGITTYWPRHYLVIDAATRRNLELEKTLLGGSREGTLLHLLNRTRTPMGARLLRTWLLQPLLDLAAIRARHDAVEELVGDRVMAGDAEAALKRVYDLERLTARTSAGTANPRDLRALADSLKRVPELRAALAGASASLLGDLAGALDGRPELAARLDGALVDQPPAHLTEGGILREGFAPDLDELRAAAAHGREWIAELEQQERERTGIKSLRVGYNQVFGYYIEVTKANQHLVPDNYDRRQTLTNSERYITPELKAMEEKVLGAEERARELEHRLFEALREEAAGHAEAIAATARSIADLDVLLSLATVALERGYCKPVVDEGDAIEIRDGRHPVVEAIQADEAFVPNDATLDCRGHRLIILTGPNMAGKSTYLRQVALVALMAQMGSFVPAREARIGLVDRIFTRVGASDDLASGRSTFMIEMTETANILHNATDRSLVILDEIGRGTSTFDGLSLAWAVAEFIVRQIGARTLFATHYHHLNELAEVMPGVRNYRIAVKEEGDRVIFLRKIMPGGTDRSYGLQVARLAGLPETVLERAREVLHQLEQEDVGRGVAPREDASAAVGAPVQLQLFAAAPDPVAEDLRRLDLDTLSPIEALMRLKELQEQVKGRK